MTASHDRRIWIALSTFAGVSPHLEPSRGPFSPCPSFNRKILKLETERDNLQALVSRQNDKGADTEMMEELFVGGVPPKTSVEDIRAFLEARLGATLGKMSMNADSG